MRSMKDSDIEAMLRRPESFLYHGDNDMMFRTWSLGPQLDHRLATRAERRTTRAVVTELRRRGFKENKDFRIERFNHFLVGWVEHLTFEVLKTEGDLTSVTRIAKTLFLINKQYKEEA